MVQEHVCERCNDSCYGDVVSIQGKFYHQYCFSCIKCKKDLLQNGYFIIDGEFYCNDDYYEIHGTKCEGCGKFVEGEVVNVLEYFYHPECFGCRRCRKIFPPGVKIAFDGDDFICEDCDAAVNRKELPKYEEIQTKYKQDEDEKKREPPPYLKQKDQEEEVEEKLKPQPPRYDQYDKETPEASHTYEEVSPVQKHKQSYETVSPPAHHDVSDDLSDSKRSSDTSISNCAGCGNDIKSGQALLALEKQWHLWCFTCHKCGCLLAGEYMGRDGVPYCEQDYQSEFGVSCAGCGGYITGKVLQAGEKHYHPQCSRCAKCGQMFGEGEEMYLQGSEIWHPQCSEEFQREAEEADQKWLNENDVHSVSKEEEEPVDTSSPRDYKQEEIKRELPPYIPQQDKNNNPPLTNGYDSHPRQPSYTSSNGSMDRKTSPHTRQPNSSSTSKPSGFRSVRPPSTNFSIEVNKEKPKSPEPEEKPAQPEESDEEDAPPKPPPPTRSSSNAFREKYTSGVYTATPFHKPAQQPSKPRPLSYIESAARQASTDKPDAASKRMTISVTTRSTSSTSSADDKTDSAQISPTGKSYQKGQGYNKLKARKSFSDKQKPNGIGSSADIDPVLRQKLKDDSEHPYEYLKTNSCHVVPYGVDRKRLEAYLTDREFYEVFQLTRTKFYGLPKWKQDDMKKKALLF